MDNNRKTPTYKILGSCIGCRNCYRVCKNNAILTGPMRIDQDKCIHCGECFRRCPGKKIVEAS